MLGIVLAGAKEMKNTSLKNLKDVRAYTNLPVLSSIPLLENALLVRRKRRLFWLAWSSAIICGLDRHERLGVLLLLRAHQLDLTVDRRGRERGRNR